MQPAILFILAPEILNIRWKKTGKYDILVEKEKYVTLRFEWDEEKNQINQKKHKISFEEAQSVFFDEEALIIDDPEHSLEEERFIILGLSKKANLLVVCHCYRESDTIMRIISARKATVRETISYNKNLF